LTDGELKLMRVLWDRGQATVADVVDALESPKPAYNTVLTLLRIMEKKGYVSHLKDGRAFIFVPAVGRADASRNALQTLVNRFFEGSTRLLMLNLLEDEQLAPDVAKQLREHIEEA
jgi:predicted transcriptional regulator